jgi:hypothetical protein
VKARKQLRAARWLTCAALVIAVGSFLISIFGNGSHELARSIASATLFGAFLINSDIGLFSGPITRGDLIRALEAQVNRNPGAL